MIPYISTGLMVLIGVTALIHKGQNRYAFLCFSILCGVMAIIDQYITRPYFSYYYLLCALSDIAIIYFVSKIAKPDSVTLSITTACMCFIYLNLFGWVAYELYIGALMYNILCVGLFLAVLVISIDTGIRNGLANNSICSDRGIVFGANYSWSRVVQGYKKAKRP